MRILGSVALAVTLLVAPVISRADKTKKTAREAAKTGADAVVDGGRLVGRTTKAFFKGGAGEAKKTAKANAKTTSEDAKANGRATRAAADEKK
jgi:hypothetical protein